MSTKKRAAKKAARSVESAPGLAPSPAGFENFVNDRVVPGLGQPARTPRERRMALDFAIQRAWAALDVDVVERIEGQGESGWGVRSRPGGGSRGLGTPEAAEVPESGLGLDSGSASLPAMSTLCVHGVGHHEADPEADARWTAAIREAFSSAIPEFVPDLSFLRYDDVFEREGLSALGSIEAVARLAGSGITSIFRGGRGPGARSAGRGPIGSAVRWTAGMVVQWVENEDLRDEVRSRFLNEIAERKPRLVLAHSLGSLIAYEAMVRAFHDGEFRRANAALIRRVEPVLQELVFVSFGSQIGNPFVRRSVAFHGRIVWVPVKRWIHLYNIHDDVFTAPLHLVEPGFTQVEVPFDLPESIADHDAGEYIRRAGIAWRSVRESAGASTAESSGRTAQAGIAAKSTRSKKRERSGEGQVFGIGSSRAPHRALLIGIDDYPDERMRLEGCVNDVFSVSALVQKLGWDAGNVRLLTDRRATAAAIRERLAWLLDGAGPEDRRILYYSGHGAQIPGYGVHEVVDRVDECLVPADFDWSPDHAILDDEFCQLYSQLDYGVRFLAGLDCCHSGGMRRDGGVRVRGLRPPDDIRHRLLRFAKDRARGSDWEERQVGDRRRFGAASSLRTPGAREAKTKDLFKTGCRDCGHYGPYMPVILEACDENEFAFEHREGSVAHGAFTAVLCRLAEDPKMLGWTWEQLAKQIGTRVGDLGYRQNPRVELPGIHASTPISSWLLEHKS